LSIATLERVSVFAGVSEAINVIAEKVTRSIVAVRQNQGGGSGVIWRPEGIILTNNHVVPGDGAEIITNDNRRLRARATAHDPINDLAVLRVDATDLPAAEIGDSRALRIGQLAIAVGHPLGLRNSVVAGIISGTGTFGWPNGGRREVIQADLDLYPGNSGGALADAEGRVIGLPAMVMGRGRAVAVPAHLAEQLLEGKPTARARFGFAGAWVPLGPLAAQAQVAAEAGLMLLQVEPGSPAERAGVLPGDIVLGRDGQFASGEAELYQLLAAAEPGVPATLETVRAGKAHRLSVAPEARSD
jgi:serine protease Do